MASFLQYGLWGLMRALRANLMTGHLGAALLAGELLKRERTDLEAGVPDCIDGELRRIMAGEEHWFDPASKGFGVPELFLPAEPGEPVPDAEAQIAEALAGTLDDFHESGHNVIFATLAMRALRHMPEAATEPVVQGIVALTRGFAGTRGGRGYYGKEVGWLIGPADPLPSASEFPDYGTLEAMAACVADEVFVSRRLNRRGYGGVVHVVNHAAALVDLRRLGYPVLASRALPAQREHFTRWRLLPDTSAEYGPCVEAPCDPRQRAFWDLDLRRDTARLTHRIKGMYGFLTLAQILSGGDSTDGCGETLRYLAWN